MLETRTKRLEILENSLAKKEAELARRIEVNYEDVMSAYPSAAVESSLSDILITEQTLPQKYYLSRKNIEFLLRRAKARKKKLPERLLQVLEKGALTAIQS